MNENNVFLCLHGEATHGQMRGTSDLILSHCIYRRVAELGVERILSMCLHIKPGVRGCNNSRPASAYRKLVVAADGRAPGRENYRKHIAGVPLTTINTVWTGR